MEDYKFTAKVPGEFKDLLKQSAARAGVPMQDWAAQAALNQSLVQSELLELFGICRQIAAKHGIPVEVLVCIYLKNGLAGTLQSPTVEELARQALINQHQQDEQLGNIFWGGSDEDYV